MFEKINMFMENLNRSKYFAGVMMILLNLGSRFLVSELSETQEQFLNNSIIRRIVVFTVVFIATKDVWVSLILTAVFIILVSNLFNENSNYCLMKKPKKMFKQISKNDYEKAKSIINLYELQGRNNKLN